MDVGRDGGRGRGTDVGSTREGEGSRAPMMISHDIGVGSYGWYEEEDSEDDVPLIWRRVIRVAQVDAPV